MLFLTVLIGYLNGVYHKQTEIVQDPKSERAEDPGDLII